MRNNIIVALSLALISTASYAQSASDPLDTRIFRNGLWLGAGAIWSNADIDTPKVDDEAFGYNVSIGYQFLNYFGVEARWNDLGEFKEGAAKVDVDGWNLDFIGGYPITQRIGISGRIGYYDFDGKVTGGGKADQDGLKLGIGLGSQVGNIIIRPQIAWYDTDSGVDLWALELNFAYKFEMGN